VSAHINIVDLVTAKSRGQHPYRHRSAQALAIYTLDNDKVFPKGLAKENGLLHALLMQVI